MVFAPPASRKIGLAGKPFAHSELRIILGAKRAEDYQERVMYQWVSGQC